MTTCEKCLEEIKEGEGITLIDFPIVKDPTKPTKFLEIQLHIKCLLELVNKGELKEFLKRIKKEKGVYD